MTITRDSKMRVISERTGELLAEIVVPASGPPEISGPYSATTKVVEGSDGVTIEGYLEDKEGWLLEWRPGEVPDYAAAALVTIEASRASGGVVKRIALVPAQGQPQRRRIRVIDADTGDLLDELTEDDHVPPVPGERWALRDGVATVVDSQYSVDPAKCQVLVTVTVRR